MVFRNLLFGFLIFFISTFLNDGLKAQDPEFTQFYANPLYLNPAFAGSSRCPRMVMNYRNQWPGITKTYITTSFSFDQHVDALSGGFGMLVTSDQAGDGTINTTNASMVYSYYLPVTSTFSVKAGIQATYAQKSVDWSKLNFGDMIDNKFGFTMGTQEVNPNRTVTNVDFSAGILGYSSSFFIGGAAHHLLEPKEGFINPEESPLPMKITAHTGAIIPIGSQSSKYKRRRRRNANTLPESSISPNILYQKQKDFQQLNLGVYVTKGPIVGGLWYRNQDAFIVLVGLMTTNFRFGYSYDVTVSRLSNATAGSHELSMTLQFNCRPKKKKFTPVSCPSF
jgi:type IX secretion system PorP/SprF family membrane protein